MRLISLKIEPRGINGWESPILFFGDRITSLYAPNGSGKTPLIQAVVFCLGYPVTFRDDINGRCEAAVLTVEVGSGILHVRRAIGKDFHVLVWQENNQAKEFFNESDFSKSMFALVGLELPKLISSNKRETHPYLATVLPIYYLDQDTGYSDLYRAPSTFITDQSAEMIRFCFGLGPKNSFLSKKDLLEAKKDLEAIDRKIVYQQKVLEDLSPGMNLHPDMQASLDRRAEELARQLGEVRNSVSVSGNVNAMLEDILRDKKQSVNRARRQIAELRDRIDGIASIRLEIQTEINTLALNEESRRFFESFDDICSNPDCGLFIGSSQSYAKNLLYLKDQIKDLERNAERESAKLQELTTFLQIQEAEMDAVTAKIREHGADEGIDQLITLIQQLTQDLFANEQKRSSLSILKNENAKYIKLLNERERLLDKISNLSSKGGTDHAFKKLCASVKALVVKWLDILETQNVSRNVEIDLDFKFKFGGEVLAAIKGSTRIRVILAVHAALFELYLKESARGLRFLILDTPKQHEMHTGDLAQYLTELGRLCEAEKGQLIFSSTEYRFPAESADAEWRPSYPGTEDLMYLGPIPADEPFTIST